MSELSETPSQEGVANASIKAALLQLHTAMIGIVVSFDKDKQTASIQPAISQELNSGEGANLPVLVDVPVQFPCAGDFVLTFPLKEGDEGLIIFSERCIDGWYQSGKVGTPLDYRMHDLSDATFLTGFRSQPNVIPDFEDDCVSLRKFDNSAYVKIDEGGNIEIGGTLLTVKCPVIFEKEFTYQSGMTGSGGGGAAATIDGDVVANGVSLTRHKHPENGDLTGAPYAG